MVRRLVAEGPVPRTILALAALALAAALSVVWSSPAYADVFTVKNTKDTGKGSLRQAITKANTRAGADHIRFSIRGAGVKTINLASDLPPITGAVTIDGYTQPGASPNTLATGNDAVPLIHLNGANAGTGANGLTITGANSTIKGLVINRFDGRDIVVEGFNTTGNKVEGNFIGTNASGTGALGNGLVGVEVAGADDTTVGGTDDGAGNRIAHNGAAGVSVTVNGAFDVEGAVGNRVLSNSIFSNGGLGIDLGANGATANDNDDPDTGANDLQNFPVIASATRSNTTGLTTITGTLNSNPTRNFTVECFVAAPDPSGFGEGQIPAGEADITTNASGDASFACISPVPIPGQAVTATATSRRQFVGDTSEFSRIFGVVPAP